MEVIQVNDPLWSRAPNPQPEFTFNDESRVVSWLRKNPCPVCGNQAYLLKLIIDGMSMFQVCCMFNTPIKPHSVFNPLRCSQEPIPSSPVKDSRLAVRAWTLAVSLATK